MPINPSHLSPRERMIYCLALAKRKVARYRAEAPEGFDPKNTWVMAAVAVGGAIYTGVSSHNAAKDAAGQAEEARKRNQLDPYNPPERPGFKYLDLATMLQQSITGDMEAYARSDADFQKRHGKIVEAENIFEGRVLEDQKGEHELSPQLQSEMMRAGLGGALSAFGDTPGTLTPGSAGEADVARHLGLGVMQFQDRNRDNRNESLMMAENIFPRRAIGLGGTDLASMLAANTDSENAFNAATYEDEVQAYNTNRGIQVQNMNTNQQAANQAAAARAAADAATTQAVTGALTGVAKSYGQSQAGAGITPDATTMAALPPGQVAGFTYYPATGYRRAA